MSLSSKLNAWIKSPQGQARLQSKLEEYNRNGIKETAAGDSVIPETRIYEAAAKFIQVLQMTAKSYDLPDSVMKHIDGMSSSGIIQTGDGFEIPLYFEGDLHRDSLENDLGYNGIDNIVALLITDTMRKTMYMVGGTTTPHLVKQLGVHYTMMIMHGCVARKNAMP